MTELNEIEKKFLEAMCIEKKNEIFFDNDRKRVFLFAGQYQTHYEYKNRLHKNAFAYECGNDVLSLINSYNYDTQGNAKLERRVAISRGNLWYSLNLKDTEMASLSVSFRNIKDKKQVEKTASPMVKPFGECPIEPFERPNKNYYYIFDIYSLNLWISNLSDIDGISLSIGSGNTYRCIRCDGKTINIENDRTINVEFNYENFVALFEKYMGIVSDQIAKQALTAGIEFMCRVVIPSMLEKEIAKRKESIASYASEGYDCSEEETKLECLEKIYREFAKYAIKDDEEYKKTIYKHSGEVRK